MITVPFLDVGAAYRELKAEMDSAVARVLESGRYILGPEVEAFEREWAAYCAAAHAVGVANGLDALTLALRALGVGRGDEVIVPSNTYIATWLAVSAVGATPVPVEPELRNTQHRRFASARSPNVADQGRLAGASLRPAGGHEPDFGFCEETWSGGR